MTLKELKKIALKNGVEPLGTKLEIIKAIQMAEGFEPCFGTRTAADCPEKACLWQKDCLRMEQSV